MPGIPTLEKLLRVVVEHNASDIHLTVGRPPTLRLNGGLRSLQLPVLEPDDVLALIHEAASKRHLDELNKVGGADFAYAFGDQARFRTSNFR